MQWNWNAGKTHVYCKPKQRLQQHELDGGRHAGCIQQTNPSAGNGGPALHCKAVCFALQWVCVMSYLASESTFRVWTWKGRHNILHNCNHWLRASAVTVFTVQVSWASVLQKRWKNESKILVYMHRYTYSMHYVKSIIRSNVQNTYCLLSKHIHCFI